MCGRFVRLLHAELALQVLAFHLRVPLTCSLLHSVSHASWSSRAVNPTSLENTQARVTLFRKSVWAEIGEPMST